MSAIVLLTVAAVAAACSAEQRTLCTPATRVSDNTSLEGKSAIFDVNLVGNITVSMTNAHLAIYGRSNGFTVHVVMRGGSWIVVHGMRHAVRVVSMESSDAVEYVETGDGGDSAGDCACASFVGTPKRLASCTYDGEADAFVEDGCDATTLDKKSTHLVLHITNHVVNAHTEGVWASCEIAPVAPSSAVVTLTASLPFSVSGTLTASNGFVLDGVVSIERLVILAAAGTAPKYVFGSTIIASIVYAPENVFDETQLLLVASRSVTVPKRLHDDTCDSDYCRVGDGVVNECHWGADGYTEFDCGTPYITPGTYTLVVSAPYSNQTATWSSVEWRQCGDATDANEVRTRGSLTVHCARFHFEYVQAGILALRQRTVSGVIASGRIVRLPPSLEGDVAWMKSGFLFVGRDVTVLADVTSVAVSAAWNRYVTQNDAAAVCTISELYGRDFVEFDCEWAAKHERDCVDFTYTALRVKCTSSCEISKNYSAITFKTLSFVSDIDAVAFSNPLSLMDLTVGRTSDAPAVLDQFIGTFIVHRTVVIAGKHLAVWINLHIVASEDVAVTVYTPNGERLEPNAFPYYIIVGSVSGGVTTLKQATCPSGRTYIGYTTAPSISCTCWNKGDKLSNGHEEALCSSEFFFGLHTSTLILDENNGYMENGFVFEQDTVEFFTPGEYWLLMPSFEAPRSITFHEKVLMKTPIIYGKERLVFHTLTTKNQYTESTRIVQTDGPLSVVVGYLDGELILAGQSISATVATCNASSTVLVDGTSTIEFGCVVVVSATPGSRVRLRNSTIAVANGKNVTVGGDGVILVQTATLVFDGFDGVVSLGDRGIVDITADAISDVIVVSRTRNKWLRHSMRGSGHRVETSATWTCQGLLHTTHTQRCCLPRAMLYASGATKPTGSESCATLGTAVLLSALQPTQHPTCVLSVPKDVTWTETTRVRRAVKRGGVSEKTLICYVASAWLLKPECA